jgi:hypothetical protein
LRSVAPGDLDICAELLGAEDPGARAFGVRGLADAPTETAFALLDRAAKDGSPVVRAAVAEAAKEIGRKALPSVVPLLSDEQRRVRRAAEDAVEALGAPELAALVFERRPTWGPGLRLFTLDYDGSEALFRTLSDKDCGEGILKALSTMDLGGSQSGIESELSGWTSSAKRRCAALILPRIATDKERAVRALKEAIASEAADADFVEVAVKSLRELEK